jgi:hypothetical protein
MEDSKQNECTCCPPGQDNSGSGSGKDCCSPGKSGLVQKIVFLVIIFAAAGVIATKLINDKGANQTCQPASCKDSVKTENAVQSGSCCSTHKDTSCCAQQEKP